MKLYNDDFIKKVFEVVDADWIAVGSDGFVNCYAGRPIPSENIDMWQYGGFFGRHICAVTLPEGMDWKDTLRKRPEPEKWRPNVNKRYYYPDPVYNALYGVCTWTGYSYEEHRSRQNLVYPYTEEGKAQAIAHAKKMLEVKI